MNIKEMTRSGSVIYVSHYPSPDYCKDGVLYEEVIVGYENIFDGYAIIEKPIYQWVRKH